MQKKWMALLLAGALALPLAACGGQTAGDGSAAGSSPAAQSSAPATSMEDMLAVAQPVTYGELLNALQENRLRAQDTYQGNTYLYTECVTAIEDDYAELSGTVKVYLPRDTLAGLNVDQRIQVVGVIDTIDLAEQSSTAAGYEFQSSAPAVELRDAYVVTDTFEVTGPIEMRYMDLYNQYGQLLEVQTGLASAWLFEMDTDIGEIDLAPAIPVEHVLGQNISQLYIGDQLVSNGDTVTISCRLTDPGASLNRDFYSTSAYEHSYEASDVSLVRIDVPAV